MLFLLFSKLNKLNFSNLNIDFYSVSLSNFLKNILQKKHVSDKL
jgi:hypothetical protein